MAGWLVSEKDKKQLKKYCDIVADSNETIIVTRKDEKNVVLISMDKYNQLEKAARNAEYHQAKLKFVHLKTK